MWISLFSWRIRFRTNEYDSTFHQHWQPKTFKTSTKKNSFLKQKEVEIWIDDMRKQRVIELSNSSWLSHVILVTKNHFSTRLGLDCSNLKEGQLSKWLSTLDLKCGCWHVEMHPDDKEKTTFLANTGLWQFTVMPFKLSKTPATFEKLMDLWYSQNCEVS